MTSYIPSEMRRLVVERARNCCEYCRLHRQDHSLPFEVDHIISEKHGGLTESGNLCLSCWDCNRTKGSDIAGLDPQTGLATLLFNPRRQNWYHHFQLSQAHILPLTPIAKVTIKLMQFNSINRLTEREILIKLNRYPCNP